LPHSVLSSPLTTTPPEAPPDFIPSEKFTKEQMEKMNINLQVSYGWKNISLCYFLIKSKKAAIAWD